MNKRNKKKYVVVNRRRFLSAIALCIVIVTVGTTAIVKHINEKNQNMYVKGIDSKKKSNEESNEAKEVKVAEAIQVNEEEKEINDNKKESNSKEVLKENFLDTSVFLGDSITEGFSFYSIVDSERVLAKKGDTTVKAMEYISSLKSINPKNIFMLYGMNDLITFQNNEDFIANYLNLIESIKKHVPNANFYVQSVLPIASFAEDASLNLTNARIDEVNKLLLKMCYEKNVNYIDISKSLKENEGLFEPDGKHIKADFYNIWVEEIKNNLQ